MRPTALAFKVVSILVAALWLMVGAVSASPRLHHVLHEDSTAPDHSCVVERISQGSFLFSPAPPIIVSHAPVLFGSFEFASLLLALRDFWVAFSRGPPTLPTSGTVAG